MARDGATQRLEHRFGTFDFLSGSLLQILVWPLISLLLAILMTVLVANRLDADQRAVQANAVRDADNLAQAYSEHLARALGEIDLLTLHIKHDWENSDRRLDLQALSQRGLYPATTSMFVTVVDRYGAIVTSTRPILSNFNISARDYFKEHARDPSSALAIGLPLQGNLTVEPTIRFTRRLVDARGAFDGIVVVSVLPAFLASFYADRRLGKGGFLSVSGKDGQLRASRLGSAIQNPPTPVLQGSERLDDDGGTRLMPAAAFTDGVRRIVAWRWLNGYPLVAVVGMSQSELMAAHEANAATYRNAVSAGVLLLGLFAVVATALSVRLARRKHQAVQVEATYRMAIDGGEEGFYMVRALYDRQETIIDFLIEDCNERGATFVGSTKSALVGKRFSDLYSGVHAQVVLGIFSSAMESGFYEDEFQVSPHSPLASGWMHRRLVRSGAGLAMTLRDISQAKQHEQMLSKMANSDSLTLLPNRHWMMHFLPGALQRAAEDRTKLAVLFVDLDDFKMVNDTQGHAAGDELLRGAALRLQSLLGPHDSVTRLGGDEFTIILEQLTSQAAAEEVAGRISAAFRQPFTIGAHSHAIGVSIGISTFPDHADTPDALLRYADIAMYAAKQEGKSRHFLYQPALSQSLMIKFNTRKALELAIERNEFVLHYQPRVNTFSGEFCSMEALVRWMHPTRGMVPPLEFIPLAEETGLILALGEMVIEMACAQIAAWQAEGVRPVPVSINVSLRQFNESDLKRQLTSSMARHGIAPHLIEIELTESCMMGEHNDVARDLAALQALGIKLLIDDFGTGYSSLSQLQKLDLDVLKVDRSFTSELGKTSEGVVFFSAIISMAHALDMTVVAEGVETLEQVQLLRDLGCDEMQGYYISRPVPAADITLLRKRRMLLPDTQTTTPHWPAVPASPVAARITS
ncbi:MAG: EAL domain-containing protein [Herminiimonas sp.]|nr:EAL domain-containing protein [Herminiimonas sp.]